jgi:hypothetical protein
MRLEGEGMEEDLTALALEDFFRLAVERGGLDLDEVTAKLKPEIADTLRQIAGFSFAEPQTRGEHGLEVTRGGASSSPVGSMGTKGIPAPGLCSVCGRLNQRSDRFCRSCGRKLNRPVRPLTVRDLVAEGRLSPEQAEEVESTLLFYQSNYTAGTRYSVYGCRCD